jgi:hypothetical protein
MMNKFYFMSSDPESETGPVGYSRIQIGAKMDRIRNTATVLPLRLALGGIAKCYYMRIHAGGFVERLRKQSRVRLLSIY